MGKCWSKFRGETIEQSQWKDICSKKVPPADRALEVPLIPELFITAYGHNGVSVVPDPSWPESYHARVPINEFYDIQSRFTVDCVRVRMMLADGINELCGIYGALPAAEVKEMHFVRCDTQALDPAIFMRMLETIHERSQIYEMSDTEGAIRVEKCRSLGFDGMVHCLFYFQNELIYEQRVSRFANLDPQNQLEMRRPANPDYLPAQDGSGRRAPVFGEKENWRNVKRGNQPPFRVYYPELTVEVKGSKLVITPDRRWSDWDKLRCKPGSVSKYLQYVDADTLNVWCPKITPDTRDTLALFIVNLSVSNCLLTLRRLTFASGDFSRVRFEVFREFLEARKPALELIGFDVGCINVQQVRDALNSVYDDEKTRPDDDQFTANSFEY